jgi:pilus assembly protein CpaE
MAIYFLTVNDTSQRVLDIEQRIKEVIPDVQRVSRLDDIARDRLGRSEDPISVLVVAPTEDNAYFERLVSVATTYRDQVFFILISEDISTTDYKRLVRTGGADWVSATGAPQEILDIIARRHLARVNVPESSGTEPVVVALVPSAGGVGNATLATEIGVWLKTSKATRQRRVCLVDLDFQNSHVCDHLDIEPQLRVQEIASNPDRFDAHLFELFTSHHSTGLDVFAAARSRIASEFTVDMLDALFDMIAGRYDLVLIDLPVIWFPWTSDIISNSSAVLVVGINTIPGLRQVAETLAAVRAARGETGSLAVVINRYEKQILGRIARRQHVESVLAKEKVFFVQEDASAVLESISTGQPMALNNASRRMVKEIGTIADFCAELQPVRAAIL